MTSKLKDINSLALTLKEKELVVKCLASDKKMIGATCTLKSEHEAATKALPAILFKTDPID